MRALARLVVLFLLIAAASAAAQDGGSPDAGEALLLGVESHDGPFTIRVTERDLEVLGAGLAVPTRTGWLRISEVGTAAESSLVVTRGERARSAGERAGKKEKTKHATLDGCSESSGQWVLSVSPARLVYNQWGASLCEGQPHAEHRNWAAAVSLGKTGKGEPDSIEKVLGAEGREALDRATGYADRDSYGDYDPAAWSFVHAEGAWRVVVYDLPSNPNADLNPLTLDVAAPPALVGVERLPSTWAALRAAHPEATDAIGAPDGRFLVLLTSEGVVALRPDGNEFGRAKVDKPLVVMTQWALGEANAARWGREARAALNR